MINRPKGIFAEVLQLANTETLVGPGGIISFDRPISFHQPRHPAHYARGIRTVHGVYMEAWINRWTIYALSDHLILIVISARDFTGRASLGYPRKYES